MIRYNDAPRETPALRAAMKPWREGLTAMPRAYISYHARLAAAEIEELRERHGLTVYAPAHTVDDGWFDGMRVREYVVETPSGRLLKLRWNDGARAFMRRCDGGGHAALFEGDLR